MLYVSYHRTATQFLVFLRQEKYLSIVNLDTRRPGQLAVLLCQFNSLANVLGVALDAFLHAVLQ